jgi:penicillin-binding protein 2
MITQNALAQGCERGAAVVLDVHTGDVLGMASLPDFNPASIADFLEREDAPFINRAISGFSIGSAFKTLISAAALEAGYRTTHRYTCEGTVEVGGVRFRCNNNAIHGDIDMARALEVSCNTYFIELGWRLDERFMLTLMRNLGLGSAQTLAPNMETQSGNVPELPELRSPAAVANFSFGQGSLLSTPLQMACAMATIANGGKAVSPRLVVGSTPDGLVITNPTRVYASNQVLSQRTAQGVQQLMVDVIERGSGRPARPIRGGAGGKTSSAQTGRIIDGVEEVHAWFAGFYPAENPRYSIVVFVEGGVSGETVAAPIFKQIADGIGGLEARE